MDTDIAGTYRDASLPVERRVQDLLARMDLDEKVGQLNQRLYGWDCYRRIGDRIELTSKLEDEIKRWRGMGTLYGLLRADPWSGVTWETGIPPERRVEVANRVQRLVLEHSRWKIPAFLSTEAPHGHMALGGILLPTAIGIGSTWNPTLYEEAARAVAAEIRLSGEHLALVSALDIARDPRWGRTEESFGEDPILAAAMARAATLGTQGESPDDLKNPARAIIVLKHFAGQGAALGGHNAGTANIGPRELREIHLPPALAGVRAGALSLMVAYNEIDGIPCCGNPELLRTMLRDEWGFRGFVMADGLALDNLTRQTGTTEAAGILGLRSGVDVGLWDEAYRTLADSVRAGRLDEREIDRAVANVLRAKFQLGLFEHPFVTDDPAALAAARTRTSEINLRLARESLVLLRNEGGVLPFRKGLRRIAVIGPNADNGYAQLGDYTPPQRDGECTTVLAGIRALAGAQTEVVYEKGCVNRGGDRSGFTAAIDAAKSADAVVLVLGGSSNRYLGTTYAATGAAAANQQPKEMDCGEGVDVADIELDAMQVELAKALRETGVPLAVVLIEGRPHALPWIAENCPAILCAWYPGQAGGRAVAEALLGDVNPSGRLPIGVPRTSGQIPVCYNYKTHGDDPYYDSQGTPQYAFGYGLSYTTFALSNLRLSSEKIAASGINSGASITVTVDVANTGARAGSETVQLYLRGVESAITRRARELKQFAKIALEPGESRTVSFKLGRDDLAIWGPDMTFAVGPGLNEIILKGGACAPLTAQLRVE
ncbi:MAG: glycoside hydrolase family 3 N-terminal domain-containing protein [Opitutaceae bacterium]